MIAYKKAEGPDDILTSLQSLWSVIEEYKEAGKILSVGLSDVDTEVFIQFFKAANVKNFHYLKNSHVEDQSKKNLNTFFFTISDQAKYYTD